MNLREQMQADVWKILFNRKELAQERMINGKPVLVIEDAEQLLKYRQQGICRGSLLLYTPEEGLGFRPEAGDALLYGSRKYTVELAEIIGGVVKMVLIQSRGF